MNILKSLIIMEPLKQINKFLKLCYSIYPLEISAKFARIDDGLYSFLGKNRLDHYYAITYKEPESLISEYKTYTHNIAASLKIVKKNLDNIPFIVIKTFSCYPHITSDLDIIVKNKKTAMKFNSLHLPIAYDINDQISWTNSPEISKKFIWNNIDKYSFHGVTFFVPNINLDILIRLGHLPFEQAELRLGEALHIYAQFSKVQWMILEDEAKCNGWIKTFNRTRKLLDRLHNELFKTNSRVNFPYRISYFSLFQAVMEKKAWNKLWGARYVIKDRLQL